jgi:hypothetical protein
MIPTFARRPIIGYTAIVVALVAMGFLSFGLWVHHMYVVGIPHLGLAFFSAASMLVAIPTAVQFFAWIATLWDGRPYVRLPMLYLFGFFIIFILGGLTGVMVALVPFDWQAHDTHFVVAHMHYVLVGGFVFPILGATYYWMPHLTGEDAVRTTRQVGILADLHRLQRDLLRHAPHRPDGHAAPRLYLSGSVRLGHAERDFVDRRIHHDSGHRTVHARCCHACALRRGGRTQPVAGGNARLGHADAAAQL